MPKIANEYKNISVTNNHNTMFEVVSKPPSIHYHMAMDVIDTWDKLKLQSNYKDRTGEMIYNKLFELDPSAKSVFDQNEKAAVAITGKKPSLQFQWNRLVHLIDVAIGMLGPDLEALEDDLIRLGRRHVAYGVNPMSFSYMVVALLYALEQMLGKNAFGPEQKENLNTIFQFMIYHMKLGMKFEMEKKK